MRAGHALPALLCLAAQGPEWGDAEQAGLAALEIRSHDSWREGDRAALAGLMAEEYRFVAMNGAVERREWVVGAERGEGRPAVELRRLDVRPDEVVVRGDTAIVLSRMEIDASVAGRPLEPSMRVLSVWVRDGGGWRLLARSITPSPPGPGRR